MSQAQVLLVEDDSELACSLGDYLSEVGFELDFAINGGNCIELLKNSHFDIIVMDISMPVMDGLQACDIIRNELKDTTPIIFLTARDTLDDKLDGFNVGGDDYLVKPFAPEELVVRLKALMKRQRSREEKIQVIGPLQIDYGLSSVIANGQTISLYEVQFKLLRLLAINAPEPVSRGKLEADLWGGDIPHSDALRTHVYRLRKALREALGDDVIKNVHGKGYRLAIPS